MSRVAPPPPPDSALPLPLDSIASSADIALQRSERLNPVNAIKLAFDHLTTSKPDLHAALLVVKPAC